MSDSPFITEKGLAVLENFQNLERLSIAVYESSLAGLQPILQLQKLRSIRLIVSDEIAKDLDGVLGELVRLDNLENVCVPGHLTDDGLKH